MASCDGWCAPTIIYVVLLVIGLLSTITTMATQNQPQSPTDQIELVLKMLIFGLIWIAVLYSLCYYCHPNIAWALIIIKFIFTFMVIGLVMGVILAKDQRHHRR